MPDDRRSPSTRGRPAVHPDDRDSPPGTPRWVLALGLIAVVVILVLIAAQLLFGMQHGPGLHGSLGAAMTSAVAMAISVG